MHHDTGAPPDGPVIWERLRAANESDSEWPFVHILIDLLARNRRLVGRMYGYGCALICLLETSADPPAPRGWPLGLALLAITTVATDHDGVHAQWCLLHTRPGRVLFYAILGLIVTLTVMALTPAQH